MSAFTLALLVVSLVVSLIASVGIGYVSSSVIVLLAIGTVVAAIAAGVRDFVRRKRSSRR